MKSLEVIASANDMAARVAQWKVSGDSVALVPTMGFLHEGHRALMAHAADRADRVVVSIFVNPLQFGTGDDFERYPRDSAADLDFLRHSPVDAVLIPDTAEIYPAGMDNTARIDAGPVGDMFEGASRPGHFDGVLTVVHRLFEIVSPDIAVFGRKDAQQVFLVDAMVRAAGAPIVIEPVDTVRDTDGLALSSRNSYLSADQRRVALAIPEALEIAAREPTVVAAIEAVRQHLASQPGITVDYVATVDPATFLPLEGGERVAQALLIVAATVGTTRLIDNRTLHFPQ